MQRRSRLFYALNQLECSELFSKQESVPVKLWTELTEGLDCSIQLYFLKVSILFNGPKTWNYFSAGHVWLPESNYPLISYNNPMTVIIKPSKTILNNTYLLNIHIKTILISHVFESYKIYKSSGSRGCFDHDMAARYRGRTEMLRPGEGFTMPPSAPQLKMRFGGAGWNYPLVI